jgi:hypothetical protein
VDLPQKPRGEGEVLPQPRQAVLQPRHITGYLDHVIEGDAGGLFQLEQQQVCERRLGALDLGGQQSFPPHVGVKEQLPSRQQG